jgi:hypothetical protein
MKSEESRENRPAKNREDTRWKFRIWIEFEEKFRILRKQASGTQEPEFYSFQLGSWERLRKHIEHDNNEEIPICPIRNQPVSVPDAGLSTGSRASGFAPAPFFFYGDDQVK